MNHKGSRQSFVYADLIRHNQTYYWQATVQIATCGPGLWVAHRGAHSEVHLRKAITTGIGSAEPLIGEMASDMETILEPSDT